MKDAEHVLTHAELVRRAAKWLRKTIRCGVVLSEHVASREIPDAIGWRCGYSYVVECKVSRSDFAADRRKPSRAAANVRPGDKCYYLTPPSLVVASEVLDGWGLLYAHPRHVELVKPSNAEPCDDRGVSALRDEIYRLYCEVRRYQVNGITYPPIPRH